MTRSGAHHVDLTVRNAHASRAFHESVLGFIGYRVAGPESRADVDAMRAHLLKIGATILDAPAEHPQYGEGYHAVFFADPDSLKLESVFKP
ncbi:MAG: hypothetical protein JSS00_01625 [Proteobacteria bacterium]|nr:hypothetical protein [Pseudomonadota bacterium]